MRRQEEWRQETAEEVTWNLSFLRKANGRTTSGRRKDNFFTYALNTTITTGNNLFQKKQIMSKKISITLSAIATLYYSFFGILHGFNDEFGKGTYSLLVGFVAIQILAYGIKEKYGHIPTNKIPVMLAIILILVTGITGICSLLNGLLCAFNNAYTEGSYYLILGIITTNICIELGKDGRP